MASPPPLQRHFVLHSRPFSNTSLLLELLSAEGVRFPAVAKGVKAQGSRTQGILQPFRPLLLEVRGRGEVRTLVRIEPGGPPIALIGRRLYCGIYINELLVRLLGRNDGHAKLMSLYEETLGALVSGEEIESPLRRFEIGLLGILGYGLLLDRDALTGIRVEPEASYEYRLEVGPVLVNNPETGGRHLSGRTLLNLASGDPLLPLARREARALMRRILGHYLGDKPLKSRELFQHFGGL